MTIDQSTKLRKLIDSVLIAQTYRDASSVAGTNAQYDVHSKSLKKATSKLNDYIDNLVQLEVKL